MPKMRCKGSHRGEDCREAGLQDGGENCRKNRREAGDQGGVQDHREAGVPRENRRENR